MSKEDFIARFYNDPDFIRIWLDWQESGYDLRMAPSVDRVDPTRGYELDNLQILTNEANTLKGTMSPSLWDAFKAYSPTRTLVLLRVVGE